MGSERNRSASPLLASRSTVELLPAPPASDTLDPDAVELAADIDKLMTMCLCSSSSDVPYQ
jgi:hypothetical protein